MRAGKLRDIVYERSVERIFRESGVRPHPQDDMQRNAPGGSGEMNHLKEPLADHGVRMTQVSCIWGAPECTWILFEAFNRLACEGAVPEEAAVSLILPADFEESALRTLVQETAAVCAEEEVRIEELNVQVSAAAIRPVLTAAVSGRVCASCGSAHEARGQNCEPAGPARGQNCEPACPAHGQNCRPDRPDSGRAKAFPGTGYDLLAAGNIAAEGTAFLACRKHSELLKKLPAFYLERAKAFRQDLSAVRCAETAYSFGAAHIYPLGEGGVFAGLWEFAEKLGCGLTADLLQIPVAQESVEVCSVLDLNPYQLRSSGSLLIAAENGERMEKSLRSAGFICEVIGRLGPGRERILKSGGDVRYLDRPLPDEILRILDPPERL